MFACSVRFRLLCVWVAVGAAPLRAADAWPQFRGPGGQGLALEAELPRTWSEANNVRWKAALPGIGWSSPVIADGRIWLTTATEDGRSLRALCLAEADGALRSDVEVFRPESLPEIHPTNSYASPSPVLADGRVVVHYGTLGTACLDAVSGDLLWRNDELHWEHQVGPGASPVAWNDLLLLACDGTDVRYVAALQLASGSPVWRVDRSVQIDKESSFRKAFCTPLLIEVDGQAQAICPGADQVVAYDPASGAEIWAVDYDGFSNVPMPVYAHGLVYVCTGYMSPKLLAIRPTGRGNVTATHVVWELDENVPTKPSPLVWGERLFLVNDAGILSCVDALSGEVLYRERLGGDFSASPLATADRLYFFREDGTTFVVAPGDEFELLSENRLAGRIMASPAVVYDRLYLRTDTHLYCLADTAASPAGAPAAAE